MVRSLNVIEVMGSSGVNTAFKNEINSSGLFKALADSHAQASTTINENNALY